MTINGSDTYLYNTGERIYFIHADGNDTIYGFNESSTLKISSGIYDTIIEGENVVIRACW